MHYVADLSQIVKWCCMRLPMKSEKQVGKAFKDHTCKVGTAIGLKSDNAKLELHGRTKDILHLYSVDNAQSEHHHWHQNQAKCKIQDVKRAMNNTKDHGSLRGSVALSCQA